MTDILDLHANESEEDSLENTLSESNDLFGEDTQFPVSQVQTRARSNTITRPASVVATNTNKQNENTETGISRKKVKNNKRSANSTVKAPLSKIPKR